MQLPADGGEGAVPGGHAAEHRGGGPGPPDRPRRALQPQLRVRQGRGRIQLGLVRAAGGKPVTRGPRAG